MQEWLNKKRDWTVYLMSKNKGHYVQGFFSSKNRKTFSTFLTKVRVKK